MIRKVLIANRSDIALRVVRACRDLGIRSVAVYSEADRNSPHVALADESIEIGPAPAPQSYLAVEKIIDAARKTGADAVHPGYGFLSENPALARAVADAGLVFVGPPAEAIEKLGSKLGTRRLMREAKVPTPPGADAPTDFATAAKLADEIGYPVLVKPSGGGGGRGMRVVRERGSLAEALEIARREAERAFGDSHVYVEKLFERARHVEVQIFADSHGNYVHVGDRDCSVQRRHQKVIEEAPAPGLTSKQHERVRSLAVRAVRAAGYVNAGTVEFLFDGEKFHLLEVNTRIQVEHCVTEEASGIDLVVEQLRVASGEKLSFRQDDVVLRGTAFEARVYAEDAAKGFVPTPGKILAARFPAGPWVREDRGIEAGGEVTPYYDGMIAKLIVRGPTREQAIARLGRALAEYQFDGLVTNVPLLRWLCANEDFRNVAYDTRWLERTLRPEMLDPFRSSASPLPAVASASGGATASGHGRSTGSTLPVERGPLEARARRVQLHHYRLQRSGADVEYLVHVVETKDGFEAVALSPRGQHWSDERHRRRGASAQTALDALAREVLERLSPEEIFPEARAR